MTHDIKRRMLYIPVLHIDTNLIDSRQELLAVNQLEKWRDDGVILINMAGTGERRGAGGQRYETHREGQPTNFHGDTTRARKWRSVQAIESVLFAGGAQNETQRNDIRIVADAIHYAAILVTNDGGSKSQPGGILGNRDTLFRQFNVRILSAEQAVDFIRSKIRERDNFNRQWIREFGGEMPDWTDQD